MSRLIKYECSENFSGHYWIILYIPPTAKLDCFLEPYLGYSTQLPLLPPTAADFKLSKETTKLDIQTTASRQHLCSTKVEQYETQSLRSAPHNHPTQLYLPIDSILFYDKSSRSQFKDINKHPFVSYIDDLIEFPQLKYMQDIFQDVRIIFRSSSLQAQHQAVKDGVGLALLHGFVAASDPKLQAILSKEISVTREYWMVVHEDMSQLARVRAVSTFFTEVIKKEQQRLMQIQLFKIIKIA